MTGRRLLILVTIATWATVLSARELTIEDRVAAQKAIEQVYWNHRIWPKENPAPKPPLSAVLSDEAIRARVEAYLKESDALDTLWKRPIRGEELQAELHRIGRDSRDPLLLRELFEALGNDPYVIAETLVRQTLAGSLVRERLESEPFESWWGAHRDALSLDVPSAAGTYELPTLGGGGCTEDTWTPTKTDPVQGREAHSAVWTGTEMIVWGGRLGQNIYTNTGGRYNPSTDSWIPTSIGANVPAARSDHTAVWTGTQMIVWGGYSGTPLGTGGRYNPSTDSWTPTSSGAGAPSARRFHTAVWTGNRMIVWGGNGGSDLNTGSRYNPNADSWQTTSTGANVPPVRQLHTAIWTGAEMIVWGGAQSCGVSCFGYVNTGGRYNPSMDSWTATSTGMNVPSVRGAHGGVWTGGEMIVWGGNDSGGDLNTGGRYAPSTDSWLPTSTGTDVPSARRSPSAVWTGSEMIVWGSSSVTTSTGGRYRPSTDTWIPTSPGPPNQFTRRAHSAVWTGNELIIWGGSTLNNIWMNTGGRYNPATDSWIETSTGPSYVPAPRTDFSAVWTGAEMIVWGGTSAPGIVGSGGRYVPATDSWSPTSTSGADPSNRSSHTAIWTGTEMIVWGGSPGSLNTGGRYNPSADSWTATSAGANVPLGRIRHSAVWTGTQMIVWGGETSANVTTNSGGRYSPATDTWTATAVPAITQRRSHTAIWTGTEMIVWGGYNISGPTQTWFNNGGRYDPTANTWTAVSTVQAPQGRELHTAVWTGSEMIVWGGYRGADINTGGRYSPSTDGWSPTSSSGVPSVRASHTAVWTGTDMIVWGGGATGNDGGRYYPPSDIWSPTSMGAGVPAGRARHCAVWTGNEMIVWGGWAGYPANSGARYCGCTGGPFIFYPDEDADGEGNGLEPTPASCSSVVPPGYSATGSDCNDNDPNNWNSCGTCADADSDLRFVGCDRYFTIAGPDCDDTNASTYSGAPEVNDGLDNQCPGDTGYGLIDELSGKLGFFTSASKAYLTWQPQFDATSYEVMRAPSPDFSSGCTAFMALDPFIVDEEVPVEGGRFYYLARPLTPHAGSFGVRSDGTPRAVCP